MNWYSQLFILQISLKAPKEQAFFYLLGERCVVSDESAKLNKFLLLLSMGVGDKCFNKFELDVHRQKIEIQLWITGKCWKTNLK